MGVTCNCCHSVTIGGLNRKKANRIYNFNGTFRNGKPLYLATRKFAMWFDEYWMIGYENNLAEDSKRPASALVVTNKNSSCPDFGLLKSLSKEWIKPVYVYNDQVSVSCNGKQNF